MTDLDTQSSPLATAATVDGPIPAAPPMIGLFEVILEVADLAAAERFYHDGLGLEVVSRWGAERPAVFLALGREGFLGLWPPESGGQSGIYGSRGGAHVHLAIRVPRGALPQMEARLVALGYTIAGSRAFGPGDIALYVFDPDDNVIEITERATLWGGAPAAE